MNPQDPQRTPAESLGDLGGYAVGCVVLVFIAAALITLLAAPINWLQSLIVPWLLEHLPWLFFIAGFLLVILQLVVMLATVSLIVVIPAALLSLGFRQTRRFGIRMLHSYIASIAFMNVYLWSIVWTVNWAGILWLIIGLLFGGVGIIPIAFVAAIIRREWTAALILAGTLVLSCILVLLADWLESKSSGAAHPEIE